MRKLILAVVAGVVGGGQAEAVVVVDPDSFSAGTDISNAFSGVTLSATRGGLGCFTKCVRFRSSNWRGRSYVHRQHGFAGFWSRRHHRPAHLAK